jgi:hypothetical protein
VSSYNPSTANKIGHLILALSAIACVAGFRGVPVFVWILAYVVAAAAASTAWREKPNLSPLTWFLGVMVFGGLAGLMYWIGVRVSGSANQPWMVFRLQGILIPVLGLVSVSGFARALYVWSYRRVDQSKS